MITAITVQLSAIDNSNIYEDNNVLFYEDSNKDGYSDYSYKPVSKLNLRGEELYTRLGRKTKQIGTIIESYGELYGTNIEDYMIIPRSSVTKFYPYLGGDARHLNTAYFKGNIRTVALYSDVLMAAIATTVVALRVRISDLPRALFK